MRKKIELCLIEYENIRQDLEMIRKVEHRFVDEKAHIVYVNGLFLSYDFSVTKM